MGRGDHAASAHPVDAFVDETRAWEEASGLFCKDGMTLVPDVVQKISMNMPPKILTTIPALRRERHSQYHDDINYTPKLNKNLKKEPQDS